MVRFALEVLTLLELLFVLVRLDELRKLGDELFAAELDWFSSSEFAGFGEGLHSVWGFSLEI